jgi:hypothetical protein
MAASATDLFTKVGSPGTATTLSAPGYSTGDSSITVASTTNWPTTTGVVFALDQVQLISGVETRIAGTYTEWEGVVTSGTTIGSLSLKTGTDQNYPAGSTTRVYIPVASARENRLVDGIVLEHNQNGTHNAAAATSIAAALPAASVPSAALATVKPDRLSMTDFLSLMTPTWGGVNSTSYITATNGSVTFTLTSSQKCLLYIHGWFSTNTTGTALNHQLLIDGVSTTIANLSSPSAVTVNQPTPFVGSHVTSALASGSHTITYQVASQGAGSFSGAASILLIRMGT